MENHPMKSDEKNHPQLGKQKMILKKTLKNLALKKWNTVRKP